MPASCSTARSLPRSPAGQPRYGAVDVVPVGTGNVTLAVGPGLMTPVPVGLPECDGGRDTDERVGVGVGCVVDGCGVLGVVETGAG